MTELPASCEAGTSYRHSSLDVNIWTALLVGDFYKTAFYSALDCTDLGRDSYTQTPADPCELPTTSF